MSFFDIDSDEIDSDSDDVERAFASDCDDLRVIQPAKHLVTEMRPPGIRISNSRISYSLTVGIFLV